MPALPLKPGAQGAGRTRDCASEKECVPCSGRWGARDQALGPPGGRQFSRQELDRWSLGALDP